MTNPPHIQEVLDRLRLVSELRLLLDHLDARYKIAVQSFTKVAEQCTKYQP